MSSTQRLPLPYRPEADIVRRHLQSLNASGDPTAPPPDDGAARSERWRPARLGRRRANRAALGAGRAQAPAAVLGDGEPAQGVPDLQRRGPGADAPGRSAAARAGRADRHRAHGRPARTGRFRGGGRQRAGAPVADRHRHVQEIPAGRPARARPARQTRRPQRGGGDLARGAAAGTPVRAGTGHGRSDARVRSGPAQVGHGPQVFVRHARRRRAHRARRPALSRQLPERDRIDRRSRPQGRARGTQRRHLDQAQCPASALRGGAARARARRAGAARMDLVRAGRALQCQPHHRRRGGGPARAFARGVRGAGGPGGAAPAAMAGLRHGAAVLPDPRAGAGRACRRPGAQVPPSFHVPPGQGRLLGRGDQAGAGDGTAALPGVHAQEPHGHFLPRLRARTAAGARRHLFAVRHAQRGHDRGDPADGPRRVLELRAAAAARHGGVYREVSRYASVRRNRSTPPAWTSHHALRRFPCGFMRRSAGTATCSRIWCAGCWKTAPTTRSCTSSPTNRWAWISSAGLALAAGGRRVPAFAAGQSTGPSARTAPASTSPSRACVRLCWAPLGRAGARRRRVRSGPGRRRGRSFLPRLIPAGAPHRLPRARTCCATPPMPCRRRCPGCARCWSRKHSRPGATAWPKCAKPWISCATTPTRPSASCSPSPWPGRPARATSCA